MVTSGAQVVPIEQTLSRGTSLHPCCLRCYVNILYIGTRIGFSFRGRQGETDLGLIQYVTHEDWVWIVLYGDDIAVMAVTRQDKT